MRSLSYLLIAAPLVSASNATSAAANGTVVVAASTAAAGNGTVAAVASTAAAAAAPMGSTTAAAAVATPAATTAAAAKAAPAATTAAPVVTTKAPMTDAATTEAPKDKKNESNTTKAAGAVMETTTIDNVKVKLAAPKAALEMGPVCLLYGGSLAAGVGQELCKALASAELCDTSAKLKVDFDTKFACKAALEMAVAADQMRRRHLESVDTENKFTMEISVEQGSAAATALAVTATKAGATAAITADKVQGAFTTAMFTEIAEGSGDAAEDAALDTALVATGVFANAAELVATKATVKAAIVAADSGLDTAAVDKLFRAGGGLEAIAKAASNATVDLSSVTADTAVAGAGGAAASSNAATMGVAGSLLLLASTLF